MICWLFRIVNRFITSFVMYLYRLKPVVHVLTRATTRVRPYNISVCSQRSRHEGVMLLLPPSSWNIR